MKNLDKRFEEAVKLASNPGLKFPPDIRLLFYAYYKRAIGYHTKESKKTNDHNENALISGFKMNALFQAKNISVKEAKKKYIELVNKHIPDQK
ncbi:MAG TPA: acyl-CoA-binding protein [Flavobacteriaceae bacterium]|nr:acyl-CoA-binding protein [Flavobacteriaceae bacterium]